MKICPHCQTSYTDDSLQFCLQDGTPLGASRTVSNNWGESETLVSPAKHDKMRIDMQNPSPQTWTGTPETGIPPSPKKSKTGLTVAVTALLTLIAAGALVIGVLFYTRGGKKEVAQNINPKPPVNTALSDAPKANKTANANLVNSSSNANTNINTVPSATPTPAPPPSLNPKQLKIIESDIENAVEGWKDATENFDLNEQMSNYAETVDYYRAGKVGAGAVRADKQRAFEPYDSIRIEISNLRIATDPSGEKATALFDKEWNFEGDQKSFKGKVLQQLQFINVDGKWRITGERDLKEYYKR